MRSKFNYLPFMMWIFPLLFFAYQFILRLWPGLMMHQIMEQFAIDASGFGMLAAFYYYGYAGMQIPAAILLERFKPKYIIFIFASLCGVATLIFSFTNNLYLGLFSRFLVGAGSALGFLGVSKVVSIWFPKEQYAKMIGYSFTFGLMGAIYGGKPVSLLIDNYGWQNIVLVLALVSIIVGCCALLILRSPQNTNQVKKEEFKLSDLNSIIKSPAIWCLAISNLLMVGTLEGFADVWGVQYLMEAYSLNKGNAAALISLIFFGMLFGGPLLALLSKKIGNYAVITLCGLGMALAFVTLLSIKTYSVFIMYPIFFLLGIMCCYQVIVFAAGADLVEGRKLGITIAFLNCVNMLGGSFFHTSIGKIMDMLWSGVLDIDGIRVYDIKNYQYALSFIPVCACIGAFMLICLSLKSKKS